MNIIKYKHLMSKDNDAGVDAKNDFKRLQTVKSFEAANLAAENLRLYKRELKQLK